MKINWIEITKGSSEILHKCDFADFTLLVGKTGVGKSGILSAIHFFKMLLDVNLYNKHLFRKQVARNYIGSLMKICFTADTEQFLYEAALEPSDETEGFAFHHEYLEKDGEPLFRRSKDAASFMTFANLPKPAADRSLLLTFSEEALCRQILAHFKKLYFLTDVLKNKQTIDYIRSLADISRKDQKVFDSIKAMYSSVFNDIEDIAFEYNDFSQPFVKILHSDGNWVCQSDISSGMLKTLTLIVLLKTIQPPAVLLIDEIENSLGVNCLDVVVEELGFAPGIQCITTSHHPYVINNISPDKWKVVSRSGSEITVRSAQELGIGDTRHDSFYQLINAYHFEED